MQVEPYGAPDVNQRRELPEYWHRARTSGRTATGPGHPVAPRGFYRRNRARVAGTVFSGRSDACVSSGESAIADERTTATADERMIVDEWTTADSVKASTADGRMIADEWTTADRVKAPACSGRGARCALHSLRSFQCLRRPSSRSERPLSSPPASADRPVCAGGNERGDRLDEARGSKHRSPEGEERSEPRESRRSGLSRCSGARVGGQSWRVSPSRNRCPCPLRQLLRRPTG